MQEILIEKKPPQPETSLAPATPMDLLSLALSKDAAIDVIERLAALQEKMQSRQSQQEYDRALKQVQSLIKPVKTNKEVKTSSGKLMYKYSSYEALDAEIRPLYVQHGFNLSFSDAECPEGRVRVVCRCSHQDGHVESYSVSLAVDPGKAGLSQTDAELAAQSKAKRRILRNIFNIVDDAEDEVLPSNGELQEYLEWIANSSSKEELNRQYRQAYEKFEESPAAIKLIVAARKEKQKEFD